MKTKKIMMPLLILTLLFFAAVSITACSQQRKFRVLFVVEQAGFEAPAQIEVGVGLSFTLPGGMEKEGHNLYWFRPFSPNIRHAPGTVFTYPMHETQTGMTLTFHAVFIPINGTVYCYECADEGCFYCTDAELAMAIFVSNINASIIALENYTAYADLLGAINRIDSQIAAWQGLPPIGINHSRLEEERRRLDEVRYY